MNQVSKDKGDGIAPYGVILAWLVVALLLAAGVAYLLIHPFLLRIHRPLSAIPAHTLPAGDLRCGYSIQSAVLKRG